MRPTIVRLDDWLSLRARTHPDRPAVTCGGRTITYATLDAGARATARRLAALGVGHGDRVATTLPPGSDFARLLHAVPKLGAVLVPLDTRLTQRERRARLEQAGARLVIDDPPAGPEGEAELRSGVEPEDPWTLLFTAGTTGRPKPVLLSHRNHAASAIASAWALGVAPDDRWLCVLPLFHVGGLAVLVRSAVYGTSAVLAERFDAPAAAAAIAAGEVTLVSLVPTMLRRLADEGLDEGPELRAVLLGGAPPPRDLLAWAGERGLPVRPTYGMTEAASQVATAGRSSGSGVAGAGARPLPGVELRIDADGEVLVRGPMVARGSVSSDGWLHTGDVGRLDRRGLLHVTGRIDEVIVTGGEGVAPREVEEALLSHPAVEEAAVLGAPDREWGEAVVAYVVASGGADAERLRAHCRERLPGFKVPKDIRLVDALPRNAVGKVERRVLASRLRGGRPA